MPFLEAIASIQAREPKLISNPAKFKFNEYLRAFSISGVGKIDTLIAYQSALETALAKGQTFNQFQKANPDLLANIHKKQQERIFRYNAIYANTRGKMLRYENAPPITDSSDGDGWYYIYHSRHDSRARHLEFDGVCLPRKHEFWHTHTPPLDWGCRCELQMFSERQIKAKGIAVTTTPPKDRFQEAGGFEPDTSKFLHNFFSEKLQRYANNAKATGLLKAVLNSIEQKKQRFLSLVQLNPDQVMDFATLPPVVVKAVEAPADQVVLSGATLQKHLDKYPETDLFDYYLVQDILEQPLAVFKDLKDPTIILIGVKFGRWYRLSVGVHETLNGFASLLHSSNGKKIMKQLARNPLLYKSPEFAWGGPAQP
ncbi:Phage (Mu-like) virion morphogenesis protein [Helicobacter heilmannii]|uniref:phage head morphogenesis protein n=1 Tax=Helicobacter heilmannii TaxID=35817 RepID=UPI0006A13BA4|nr:phage minor head protein [Helicobacter heilmannii]CRF50062.1 Phage (Mu-like) virion morphogenesis protein [Helicobacter heilmannii]